MSNISKVLKETLSKLKPREIDEDIWEAYLPPNIPPPPPPPGPNRKLDLHDMQSNDYDSNDVYYAQPSVKPVRLMGNMRESELSKSMGKVWEPISNPPPQYHTNSGQKVDIRPGVDTEQIALMIRMLKEQYEPVVAVITCKHCGQWGARFCECKKCGAPIE